LYKKKKEQAVDAGKPDLNHLRRSQKNTLNFEKLFLSNSHLFCAGENVDLDLEKSRAKAVGKVRGSRDTVGRRGHLFQLGPTSK
jgi:hypothetical protein